MCVNDIVVQGAEPLFFLDYYATGKLDVDVAASVVNGIANGCELSGCALVGGETAEMPDWTMLATTTLLVFVLAVVEEPTLLTVLKLKAGDQIIALASSGPPLQRFLADP